MGQTVGVQLLGRTALVVDGTHVELGSTRQRRLLAALALDAGTVVPADRLAERVWADGELPDDPRRALRTNLTRLRQAIGDVEAIATEPTGWRLDDAQVSLDTRRFDELVASAGEPGLDVHGRLGRLDAALALWRGGAYEDLAGEEWVRAEAARLDELRLTAIERRYDAMLAAGMHTDALPGLTGEVDANPLRDRLVGLQMLALYRSGRQAEATRVYEQHRRRLADELGLDPGAELHQLDSRIVAGDPSLHLTSTAGTPLRSYRLGEQLGEGAFAVVYRGTQPSVGRDVAVKVIRAELANRPEFVRRFEAEAHLVARLEHPYIVPLYDYWREPDRACLVFRYLRGGTLEARLTSGGPLSLDECAAMVSQIGAGLVAAHAEGVVHRDVKPANVFLDEVGNFYLGDFGIALETTEVSDPTAALSAGSPAYASPEQLRREPVGPPADVHGLGISLYESLTGRLPFPAAASQAELLQHQLHDPIPDVREQRAEVPPAIDAVIQRATAKRPGDRYQTVQELVADFEAALRADPATATVRPGSATLISTGETHNPYKGLRAFTEADSGDFHGRERLVDRLITLMSQTGTTGRIAAVVGPSGIGKSSVVRAGLLPALRRGEAPGSAEWFVATMLPGANPFDELAAALLRVATHAPDNLMGMLTEDRRGIARMVKALVPEDDGSDVLLVIDQFEELFTLTAQADTVRFLDALEHAVTDARCPLRVVLTMRADFWDRPLRHGAFARLIDSSTVNVTALAPDELERAIVAPAHHLGVEFEPGLVSEIVADVNDQPGALPLLQYALTELWDRQLAGVLTREAYGELGGVTGALARRAEEIYSGSPPDKQEATRRVLGRLVTLGEGTEDVRRRATRSEVGDDPATTSVIEAFGAARLLSFDHDPSTREPTLEVAHEALIREWPRLRGWLDDDRDGLRIHRHLTESTGAWIDTGRDEGELYRGGRLEAAQEWANDHAADLNVAEVEFLDASNAAHEAEQGAEQARFDEQVRHNRRLRVLAAMAGVIAVIAASAGVFALQQRARADDEADDAALSAELAQQKADEAQASLELAEARADEVRAALEVATEATDEAGREAERATAATSEAEARAKEADIGRVRATALNVRDQNLNLALLLAAEAYRLDPTRANESALHRLLVDTGGIEATMAGIYGKVFLLEEGRHALAAEFDGFVEWDLETRTRIRTIERPIQVRTRSDLSSEAGLLVVSDPAGTELFDLDSGELRWEFAEEAASVSFSPAGGALALAFADRVEIRDLSDPAQPSLTMGREGGARYIAWAPAGDSYLVVKNDGTIEFWELDGEAPTWATEPSGAEGALTDEPRMLFTSDGSAVVIAQSLDEAFGQTVRILAVSDGTQLGSGPLAASNDVLDLEWLDEAALRVWATINPGGVQAYDLGGGETIEPPFQSEDSWSVEYSPALDRYIVATISGLQIRHPLGAGPIEKVLPLTPEQTAGAPGLPAFSVSRDGTRLLLSATSPPFNIVEYDLTSDPTTYTVTDLRGLAPGFNGYTVLVNESMVLLDENREPMGNPTPTPADAWPFGPSPDGRFFVAYVNRGHLELYRSSGEYIGELRVPGGEPATAPIDWSFSADGSRIIVYLIAGNLAWATFDMETGELVEQGDPDRVIKPSVVGGTMYAQRNQSDFSILRLDPDTLEPVGDPLVGHTGGRAFVADGGPNGLVATAGFDGTVRVWDVETGAQIGAPIEDVAVVTEFAAEGRKLVTLDRHGASVWNFDTATWADIACDVAGRNMKIDEWEEFGPTTVDYRATCSQFPLDD